MHFMATTKYQDKSKLSNKQQVGIKPTQDYQVAT